MPRLLLIALVLSGCTVRAVSVDDVGPRDQRRIQVQHIQQEAPVERPDELRRGELTAVPTPTITSEELGGQEGEPVVDPPTEEDGQPPLTNTPDPDVDDADSDGIHDGTGFAANETGDTGDTDDTDAE